MACDDVVVQLSGRQAGAAAKKMYLVPGITAIQGDPELIDAVMHGGEFPAESEEVTVRLEISGLAGRDAVAEAVGRIDGVSRVRYDSEVTGWA